jgi:hypothetical protein
LVDLYGTLPQIDSLKSLVGRGYERHHACLHPSNYLEDKSQKFTQW